MEQVIGGNTGWKTHDGVDIPVGAPYKARLDAWDLIFESTLKKR